MSEANNHHSLFSWIQFSYIELRVDQFTRMLRFMIIKIYIILMIYDHLKVNIIIKIYNYIVKIILKLWLSFCNLACHSVGRFVLAQISPILLHQKVPPFLRFYGYGRWKNDKTLYTFETNLACSRHLKYTKEILKNTMEKSGKRIFQF